MPSTMVTCPASVTTSCRTSTTTTISGSLGKSQQSKTPKILVGLLSSKRINRRNIYIYHFLQPSLHKEERMARLSIYRKWSKPIVCSSLTKRMVVNFLKVDVSLDVHMYFNSSVHGKSIMSRVDIPYLENPLPIVFYFLLVFWIE